MKPQPILKVFTYGLIALLFSCKKPNQTENSGQKLANIEVEKPTSTHENSARTQITVPTLSSQKPFKIGDVSYNSRGEVQTSFSKLKSQTTDNKLIITDNYWQTHFEDVNKYRKVVFFSTQRGNENYQLFENCDFSEMKGYAFAPVITYLDKNEFWKGKKFVQDFFYIPSDSSLSTFQIENQLYFVKPPQLSFNPNSNLPQYYKFFPRYELPKSKMGVNMFKTLDMKAEDVLAHGNTYAPIATLPKEKQLIYDYDDWLYHSGCPKAYSVANDEVAKWLERVDKNKLLANFIEHFYERYKDYGYVAMDFEAISGGFYGPGVSKVEACLEYWKTHPHQAKLAICGYKGVGLSRIYIEGNNESKRIDEALNFKGAINDLLKKYSDNIFQTNDILAKYIDFHYIGNYLNYPINYGYVHHFLIENELDKKYFPNKKNIVNFWHNQEYVGDFELGWTYFKTSGGRPLKKYIKPVTFPDAMYNAAVWAFTMADGGEIWSEPYPRTDNADNYGWGENTYSMSDEKQPDKYGPEFSVFSEQNFQNIDWWEAGKWAICQNKGLIDAPTKWEYISTKRKGENWTTNKTKLPHFSLYEKTPLAVIKFDTNKNTALVLVYDAWNNPLKREWVDIQVNGKIHSIQVNGRFTSIVKIDL